MSSLLPIPIFFSKKEGAFNDEHTIELVEQKLEDTIENEVTFVKELK